MVRQALVTDCDFMESLYFHQDINPYLLYEMDEKPNFPAIYADLLAKEYLYVFEVDEQKAGMFKLFALTYRASHVAYLGGVAVHPDFSGRGLGQVMMVELLDFAKQKGFLRVELSTATINDKAIRLYEKVGFEREGILRRYTYLKSENRVLDEILMSYLF